MPGRGPIGAGGAIFVDARAGSLIDFPVESEMLRDPRHLREVKEIEIARLHLRYAHTRSDWPERVMALAGSIERFGQILPVIVLREEAGSFILIDGYLRVQALKRCGRDTLLAEIWGCKEQEALVQVLARSHSRKWDLLEEAALLQELRDRYDLSQSRIASMVGRRQSWVSGRLALYQAVSPEVLALIRKGAISTWAATRVIVPIARAIPEHAQLLSENLSKGSASTREMACFFQYYQRANRRQRDNMVREPFLFLKSLRAKDEAAQAKVLKEGLEGRWLRDWRGITQMLRGLLREIPSLFCSDRSQLDRRILLSPVEETERLFRDVQNQIRRYDPHDHRRDEASHFESLSERSADPADQSNSQALPKHDPPCDPGEMAGETSKAIAL
jgi:ParB family transcriptional regulator, chromosome partitioning protein